MLKGQNFRAARERLRCERYLGVIQLRCGLRGVGRECAAGPLFALRISLSPGGGCSKCVTAAGARDRRSYLSVSGEICQP